MALATAGEVGFVPREAGDWRWRVAVNVVRNDQTALDLHWQVWPTRLYYPVGVLSLEELSSRAAEG